MSFMTSGFAEVVSACDRSRRFTGVRENEKTSDIKRECPHRSRSESRVVQSERKSFHLQIRKNESDKRDKKKRLRIDFQMRPS